MNCRLNFLSFTRVFFLMLFLTSFLGAGFISQGQTVYTKNFTIEDGLPSNIVRAVFKDSRGIMWIGTGAGLCRFNGREFKVYNSSNGLGAENIFDITEDNQGNLWIGAMGEGISKFDGIKFTNYTTKNGLLCNDVRRVWWSKKFNILLIGTNKGCSVFDGIRFYSLSGRDLRKNDDTYFILGFTEKDTSIELNSYTNLGLYKFYPFTHQFSKYPSKTSPNISTSCSPIEGKNGDTIWSCGRMGIMVWNKGLKASFDSMGQPFHMTADAEKNIWIAAWTETAEDPAMPGGLYLYDGTKVVNMTKKTGISDPSVWTVFYDTVFHVLWVGTLHQGLYRMPLPCFEWYAASWFGLSSIKINDIYADRHNNLWITTTRDIIRKNGETGYVIYNQKEIQSVKYKAEVHSLPLIRIGFADMNGSFEKYEKLIDERKYPYPNPYFLNNSEFGTEKIAPPRSLYNPAMIVGMSAEFSKRKNDTSANCYYGIGEDSHHNIYFSAGLGVTRFTEADDYKKPEVLALSDNNWIFAFDKADTMYGSSSWNRGIWKFAVYPELFYPKRSFYSAEKDNAPDRLCRMISRGNEIWSVSRIGGLYLTLNGKNYAFCKTDSSLPQSMNDICIDGEQNIITGTNDGEVLISRMEGEKLKVLYRLSGKDGIVGNSIRWVQTDKKRQLYVGSNQGLNIIDLNTLFENGKANVRFFSRETGYFDCSGKRAVVDTAGDIWIATDKNICRIDRTLILNNPAHKAEIVLTGLELNNMPLGQLGKYPLDAWFGMPKEELSLSHDQNNLVFYLDALNYLDAEHQEFRYRLLPAIKTWSEFSPGRRAVFTTLGSNKYTLEVESIDPLDHNQVSRLSYQFTIRPPFYFTWWFILVALIVLSWIVFIAMRLRSRQIRRQEKQKADARIELSNIEMKALKAQMNPHFIFNAINSIQSFILGNNVDKALYYLSMFAKLVRKTLENTAKEFIPLCEELEYLNYYVELEKMRFEGQFTTELDIDPHLQIETTMIPPMIVQPFIENAIKHGLLKLSGIGHLTMKVKKLNETQFVFTIEDNGIGRKKAAEQKQASGSKHNSRGMDITNTRLHLLNMNGHKGLYTIKITDLYDLSGNPRGPRVELAFPISDI